MLRTYYVGDRFFFAHQGLSLGANIPVLVRGWSVKGVKSGFLRTVAFLLLNMGAGEKPG